MGTRRKVETLQIDPGRRPCGRSAAGAHFHVVFTLPAAIANIAYAVSQRIRKRIEEAFGWIKTIAGQDKTSFRGRDRVGWAFIFAAAATI